MLDALRRLWHYPLSRRQVWVLMLALLAALYFLLGIYAVLAFIAYSSSWASFRTCSGVIAHGGQTDEVGAASRERSGDLGCRSRAALFLAELSPPPTRKTSGEARATQTDALPPGALHLTKRIGLF
jgi:hypothetical protein